MSEVVIVGAARTAIGSFGGALSSLSAAELGKVAIEEALKRSQVAGKEVDEVVLGQVLTAAAGMNPARQASMAAGIPQEKTAMTINQVCGSGLRAVALGAQAIRSEDAGIVVAGGQESMSQSPHAQNLRSGQKMGNLELIDTMIKDGLWDHFNGYHMGNTAENVAKKYDFSREVQQDFSINSHKKAFNAQNKNYFNDELTSINIDNKIIELDEAIRPNTSQEILNGLKLVFDENGTVTAGTSSPLTDGAAATLVCNESYAIKNNLPILAKIISTAVNGCPPELMGLGPIGATKKALKRANLDIKDMDIIELNEAFASQSLACIKDLNIDPEKVNIDGGAIALGHPLGATGTRITAKAAQIMQREKKQYALATQCIGLGQGIATILKSY